MPKGEKFVQYPDLGHGNKYTISKDYHGKMGHAIVTVSANNKTHTIGKQPGFMHTGDQPKLETKVKK